MDLGCKSQILTFAAHQETGGGPREVAQAGSAPGLGPGGRRFESCLPDESKTRSSSGFFHLYKWSDFITIVNPDNKMGSFSQHAEYWYLTVMWRRQSYFVAAWLLLTAMSTMSCTQQETKVGKKIKQAILPNKTVTLMVLPLGNIENDVVKETYTSITTVFPSTRLLRKEMMPGHTFYRPRQRYRADSLIAWMRNRARPGEVYVGITSQDISTTHRGQEDYGVMGLGFRPGKACIASSFRLKDKSNYYKVVLHEVGHTTGLPHCPVHSCFMVDAEGQDKTSKETGFCTKCTQHLRKKGWKI